MAEHKGSERSSRNQNIKLSTNGSALSDISGLDAPSSHISGRDKIRARIHQRSSRLLTLFGFRNSVHAGKLVTLADSGSLLNQESGTPIYQTVVENIRTNDIPSHPLYADTQVSSVAPKGGKEMVGKIADDAFASPSIDVRRSQSTPIELARIVSNRLSAAFGSPTVVRRSHLNQRQNIRAVHFPSASNRHRNAQHDLSRNSSESSCSVGSNSNRESTQSTPPTSVEPSGVLNSSDQSKETRGDIAEGEAFPHSQSAGTLSPIREMPSVSPSIITVEAAANAKVFFETHFNTIFSGVDSRVQRQQELEQYIFSLPLAPEDKVRVKKKWILQEREYLRQWRVLKARSHSSRKKDSSASIAGFEIIKVLGKGSFGVVRLVREKTDTEPEDRRRAMEIQELHSVVGTASERDQAQLGPRCDHRKPMTGIKKNVFAMKVIRKSIMIRNSQEAHLRAERDFLVASAKSRWIVPLIASFQDDDNLYLVMDYMVGGDFLGLLMRRNILPENIARWYVAEMILCVEEAHRLSWIHRDIKPDNFLISASGHLKISDFGLAFDGHWAHDQLYYKGHRCTLLKRLGIQVDGDLQDQKEALEGSSQAMGRDDDSIEDRFIWTPPPATTVLGWRDRNLKRRLAKSVVGTSQYMAPEVVRGHYYDGRCDWWSIGIILYECLYGFTPFASEDRHKTKLKIHHHLQTLYFPVHRPADKLISAEAVDLINYLLQEKEYRLSSSDYRKNDATTLRYSRSIFYKGGHCSRSYKGPHVFPNDAAEIKAHLFFRGIIWDELHRTSPPFVPKVKNWEDTRYFDDVNGLDCSSVPTDSETSHPGLGEGGVNGEKDEQNHADEGCPQNQGLDTTKSQRAAEEEAGSARKGPVREEKKPRRPRDKILRDKRFRKTALDMRKKGAFLGYTYRRPKGVIMALSPDRGRPFVSRGQLSELYG